MLVCLLPIPDHCPLVTQGWNKDFTSQNVTRTTVWLFLKLKVRSISTSQQNGPQNRWLRIILAYTSPYWIKISLLCIVYWGQHSLGRGGSLSSPNFMTLTGAIHPTPSANFILLEWEEHRAFTGCYELWWLTLLVFYSQDTSLSSLPSHHLSFITTKSRLVEIPHFPSLTHALSSCHWSLSSHAQLPSPQFCFP